MSAAADNSKQPRTDTSSSTRIGLALGSGAARGWAHIGVIRALAEIGIEPDIVAGSSIGAFVGAAYATDHLDTLANWVRSLNWKTILDYMDLAILEGGVIQGENLLQYLPDQINKSSIESLSRQFGAVATELYSGREIWFRSGPLVDAVRASIGLPGLFAPVKIDDRWLVDGGLVNPVPVSLCRAMGADIVIAVNLNGDILGKHRKRRTVQPPEDQEEERPGAAFLDRISAQLKSRLQNRNYDLLASLFSKSAHRPGMFEVLASSINIMQDRITRSRMAGDPPDVILSPRLAKLGLMEFDKAGIAIAEGHACVQRMRPALEQLLANL